MLPEESIRRPAEWMTRAEANLALAKVIAPGVLFEDLCFQAQQAAEKALKAVLIARSGKCPFVHDLDRLLADISTLGLEVSEELDAASVLSRYAVETRYPGLQPAVTQEEYRLAIAMSEEVLAWARIHV